MQGCMDKMSGCEVRYNLSMSPPLTMGLFPRRLTLGALLILSLAARNHLWERRTPIVYVAHDIQVWIIIPSCVSPLVSKTLYIYIYSQGPVHQLFLFLSFQLDLSQPQIQILLGLHKNCLPVNILTRVRLLTLFLLVPLNSPLHLLWTRSTPLQHYGPDKK